MRRRTRTHWMLIAFAPGALVAGVCFVQAAWWKMVRGHPKWDDFFLVGVAWLMAAVGAGILLRVVWAAIVPERWLPRWLAVVLLLLAIAAALLVLGFVWFASSFGP